MFTNSSRHDMIDSVRDINPHQILGGERNEKDLLKRESGRKVWIC